MKPGGPIGVVGAGSWGTTLAQVIADKGFEVDLWVFEPELCRTIRETRQNDLYLPDVVLHGRINAHNDLDRVVKDHDLLIMVVPSHVYRNVATAMIPFLKPDAVVVNATKGIENDTLLTMSGIWREVLPSGLQVQVLCLSGPSFAREVARKVPTAVTLAGDDLQTAKAVQHVISTGYFRIYTSLDKIGVEIAGASKNVIALAAGVSDGMSFGYNSRAALITRGLAEITRLGVKMGSNPLTFLGLAGIGDLLLTCTGDLSRNRTVGIQLGQGRRIKDILAEMRMVAEGVKTAKSIHFLARRIGVEMPICEQVYRVLYEDKDPRVVVRELMERDLKHELELGH
ncbi:MAG TPA: NAD(P)H-dependent glycerol-3-phosphate dehydrogenase [Syntrophobacter fumaroxidans]|nr:NAD(P)H-dependent glycerol-3-phosphate dehydrogenase [Syntrophobacter fumaroxidans]